MTVVEIPDQDPYWVIRCVLYVTETGRVRVTKNLGTIKEGEIAIATYLTLHKSLWESTFLRADISVGEQEAYGVEINAAVKTGHEKDKNDD